MKNIIILLLITISLVGCSNKYSYHNSKKYSKPHKQSKYYTQTNNKCNL
jgi:uncharacterized protein YceK